MERGGEGRSAMLDGIWLREAGSIGSNLRCNEKGGKEVVK